MSIYDQPVAFKPPAEIDPVEEAASYVNNKWFQQLLAVKTECFRCHAESPIIHVHYGVLAFGNPRALKNTRPSGARPQQVDITKEAQKAFADIGWKFQLRRSYCPQCKGMGST